MIESGEIDGGEIRLALLQQPDGEAGAVLVGLDVLGDAGGIGFAKLALQSGDEVQIGKFRMVFFAGQG